MAQNVVIRSVTYQNVPSVEIPKSGGGGNAVFIDTSDATLNNASKLPNGVTAYANGTKYTGNAAENDSSDLTVSAHLDLSRTCAKWPPPMPLQCAPIPCG